MHQCTKNTDQWLVTPAAALDQVLWTRTQKYAIKIFNEKKKYLINEHILSIRARKGRGHTSRDEKGGGEILIFCERWYSGSNIVCTIAVIVIILETITSIAQQISETRAGFLICYLGHYFLDSSVGLKSPWIHHPWVILIFWCEHLARPASVDSSHSQWNMTRGTPLTSADILSFWIWSRGLLEDWMMEEQLMVINWCHVL